MNIRLANNDDFKEIANMRWLHCSEDDIVYGEKSTFNVDKEQYLKKVVSFLKEHNEYIIFVAEDNDIITACMFIYLVPKIPNPNGESKYIAYLTKVYTKQEYRNKGIGTNLLYYIKDYLKKLKCELIFAWPSDNSVKWYKKNEFSNDNDIMECILMDE